MVRLWTLPTACLLLLVALAPVVVAEASPQFVIDRLELQVQARRDGGADLHYRLNLTVRNLALTPLQSLRLPLPSGAPAASSVVATLDGAPMSVSGDDHAIRIHFGLSSPGPGMHGQVDVQLVHPRMVYRQGDSRAQVSASVGALAHNVEEVRQLQMVLRFPPALEDSADAHWIGSEPQQSGWDPGTGLYSMRWDFLDIDPQHPPSVGISFPKEAVVRVYDPFWDVELPGLVLPLSIGGALIGLVVALAIGLRRRKPAYVRPQLTIPWGGVRLGLDPFDVALMLGRPERTLRLVLGASLAQLGLLPQAPSIPLLAKRIEGDEAFVRKVATALGEDGSLDEGALARLMRERRRWLRRTLEAYAPQQTAAHYLQVVADAWGRIGRMRGARRDEAVEALLPWLLIDEDGLGRLERLSQGTAWWPPPEVRIPGR